jgi:hypothetical protein
MPLLNGKVVNTTKLLLKGATGERELAREGKLPLSYEVAFVLRKGTGELESIVTLLPRWEKGLGAGYQRESGTVFPALGFAPLR